MSEGEKGIVGRSFDFALRIIRLSRELDKSPGTARTLSRQILRAGTSIGANVEEAQAAQSKADFTAKMYIACKEARETHYWLRLLSKSELIPETKLSSLKDEANQLIAILTTITKKSRVDS